MAKTNAEHQAAHRQRTKDRIKELEAEVADLKTKNAKLKAMVETVLRKTKERNVTPTEPSYVRPVEDHGPDEEEPMESVEPMGYVMPWEI